MRPVGARTWLRRWRDGRRALTELRRPSPTTPGRSPTTPGRSPTTPRGRTQAAARRPASPAPTDTAGAPKAAPARRPGAPQRGPPAPRAEDVSDDPGLERLERALHAASRGDFS